MKQISITLERIETTSTRQHFGSPTSGHPTRSETVTDKVEYEVVQLRNAVVVKHESCFRDCSCTLKIGTRITEKQADDVARSKNYEVTVK